MRNVSIVIGAFVPAQKSSDGSFNFGKSVTTNAAGEVTGIGADYFRFKVMGMFNDDGPIVDIGGKTEGFVSINANLIKSQIGLPKFLEGYTIEVPEEGPQSFKESVSRQNNTYDTFMLVFTSAELPLVEEAIEYKKDIEAKKLIEEEKERNRLKNRRAFAVRQEIKAKKREPLPGSLEAIQAARAAEHELQDTGTKS